MKRTASTELQEVISSEESSFSPANLEIEVNNGESDTKVHTPTKEMTSGGGLSSSSLANLEIEVNNGESDTKVHTPTKEMTSGEAMTKRAEMYQEYMKQIPIPMHRGSVIPFTTWMGLGKSIKELYGQPLHYLTNILLKQWDGLRIGSSEEYWPLDTIMHPSKAEVTIWLIEEVHRRTSSSHHIAKLWLSDPMYHASIDSIFPQLSSSY